MGELTRPAVATGAPRQGRIPKPPVLGTLAGRGFDLSDDAGPSNTPMTGQVAGPPFSGIATAKANEDEQQRQFPHDEFTKFLPGRA